jgi:hypothetical protein
LKGRPFLKEKQLNERIKKNTSNTIQRWLDKRLDKLERLLSINDKLRVVWVPDSTHCLSGEVKGNVIFVYETSKAKASAVLVHEVIDYSVSQAIEPYKELANVLIKNINSEAYKKKEKVVEALSMLLIENEGLLE